MFTLPMRPRRPEASVSSMRRQAASLWMVAKVANRRVPAAQRWLRKAFQARSAKALVVADAPVDDLGGVDVQVGKGGDDEGVPPVLHRLTGVFRGQGVIQTHDGLALGDQPGVFTHLQFPQCGGVKEGSFQDHVVLLSGLERLRAAAPRYSPARADR